jgi:hypothetical protein
LGRVGGAEGFVGGINGEEDGGDGAEERTLVGGVLANILAGMERYSRDQVGNEAKHGCDGGVA